LATTELCLETEDRDRVLLRLQLSGKRGSDLLPGDVGQLAVMESQSELVPVEEGILYELINKRGRNVGT
jgi:hypothetical protein